MTEIYDYMRLLYENRYSHCPKCGREIKKQTVDQTGLDIMGLPEKTKFSFCPCGKGPGRMNMRRFWIMPGEAVTSESVSMAACNELPIEGNQAENIKHNIDIVVDRLMVKEGLKRLADSISWM